MDFRRLPSNRTLPPSRALVGSRALVAGLALLVLSAPMVRAEPLAEIGSSFDEAGRALNRQIGDWVGAPAKPRASMRRRVLPATAPLPPLRPAEFSATAPSPVAAPAAPATAQIAAAEPLPAPEAPPTAGNIPLPPVRPSSVAPTETPPETSRAKVPPAEERIAALPSPPAGEVSADTQAATPAKAVPTICPELSNGDIGVFEPSVVTATDPLCTVDRGVTLSAVRMKDGRLVTLNPAATLRCEMAASVAVWLREKVEPMAATLGAPLDKVEVAASQQCRPRNRVTGAKISEHGRGNALDIGGFVLKDGRIFVIGTPSGGELAMPLDFQETLKLSACADFTTILGPGSDGYHEKHLHVDRAERRSGAVLCQWATARIEAVVPKPPVKPAEPANGAAGEPAPAATGQ